MKNDYRRAIHLDFHTLPGIYDINDFNAEDLAQVLYDANVTYVNIAAECNLGFCYYPTKIGVVYPGLKKDLFGETLRALKKRGIGVSAYINVGFNNANLINHPEWCVSEKDGRILFPEYDQVRRGCLNTGYAEFIKKIIGEILEYDPDGIFCDCVSSSVVCYCNKCVKDLTDLGIDYEDRQKVFDFYLDVREKFCREVREMVGNRHVFFNGMLWDKDYEEHIEHECLPTDPTWSYEYFLPYAAHARNCGKEMTYMTGRFQTSWGDFGGIRTKASLENDMYDAVSNGLGFCVGDHAHPARALIKPLYKTIGEVFGELAEYEKWTDGTEYIAEIGILSDVISYDMWKYMGVCRLLSELKHDYDIIRSSSDFSKYKLIVLPNETLIDGTTKVKLRKFLDCGGKILSTGNGGLTFDNGGFALEEYNEFLSYDGKDTHTHGFFRFTDDTDPDYSGVEWAMYKPSVLMTAKKGEILASYISAYFDKHFDGLYSYFYVPPEKETKYSSAVYNGKNIVHICFDLFNAYGENFLSAHKKLAEIAIGLLLPEPQIRTVGLPKSARVTLTGKKEYKLVHVKVDYPECKGQKGIIEEHTVQPAGAKVFVKGKYKEAFTTKKGERLSVAQAGNYSVITLPEVVGYLMIVIK
ncbi:MAG: alpha-L-fucosidase [Clostridia bacterium]|nr:alpha-L-fucosidase [Clostridia bacterium]